MGNDKDATQAPTSILEISAFDADARVDPHSKLKQLRESGRFLRDEGAKTWLLSHYADILSMDGRTYRLLTGIVRISHIFLSNTNYSFPSDSW